MSAGPTKAPEWLNTALRLRAHPKFPRHINRLLLHAVTLGDPVYECDWCGDIPDPDTHGLDCHTEEPASMRYPDADLAPHLGEASNGSLIFDLLPAGWVAAKVPGGYRCYLDTRLRTSTKEEGYHAGLTLAEAAGRAFLAVHGPPKRLVHISEIAAIGDPLLDRLEKAMGTKGDIVLEWTSMCAWELQEDGVPVHVFAGDIVAGDLPETVVPGLLTANDDIIAALRAILAVVE